MFLAQVDPLVTDVGVVAAVLVAVIGAIKAIVVPLRRGLQMLDRIEAELTVNGGEESTKDRVLKVQETLDATVQS